MTPEEKRAQREAANAKKAAMKAAAKAKKEAKDRAEAGIPDEPEGSDANNVVIEETKANAPEEQK